MVRRIRPTALALGLLLLGLGVWSWLQVSGATGATLEAAREPRPAESPLPRIGLERLRAPEASPEAAPGRDVFRFGRPPARATAEPEQPPVRVAAAPTPVVEGPATPPPPPTLPPLAVKYIGTLEQKGMKVAVLLTDEKKEVLTGREGETVANRLRIVKIGIESVDVQDLGSDRTRRIPLRGN